MLRSSFLPMLVVLVAFLQASHSHAADDLKKLQGTWVGTENGHEDEGEVTISIMGNKISFNGWRQGEWYKGTFDIAKQDGRSMLRGTIKECPVPEMIGKSSNGLYKLEDGTLTIAARAPGDPEEPEGFDDPKVRSFTLKKHD